jgi:hypothetical protein
VICGLYKLESIDLSVVSIHSTYNQWAAAPSAKMAHARKVSVYISPISLKQHQQSSRTLFSMTFEQTGAVGRFIKKGPNFFVVWFSTKIGIFFGRKL